MLMVSLVKGLLVVVWFGFLGSCDGIETSRGTFSDLFKMFEPKKKFRFPTKNTPESSFRAQFFTILAIFGTFWAFEARGKKLQTSDGNFLFFVFISQLLKYNSVPYGNLRIFRFPESTLLVVENRLRKV